MSSIYLECAPERCSRFLSSVRGFAGRPGLRLGICCAGLMLYARISMGAVALPGPSWNEQVISESGGSPDRSTSANHPALIKSESASPNGDSGSAMFSATADPFPIVSGITNAETADFGFSAQGVSEGSLLYYFEVLGPTKTVNVNVQALLKTHGLISGGNAHGLALAELDVGSFSFESLVGYGGQSWNVSSDVVRGGSGDATGNLLIDQDLQFNTNTAYRVQLITDISASAGLDQHAHGSTSTFSASVDPQFMIASDVDDPTDYSIILSAGIPNAITVPETNPAVPEAGTFGWGAVGLSLVVLGIRKIKVRRA